MNYKTLLTFIALQVVAIPVAFLISAPEKVHRSDGTKIVLAPKTTLKQQLLELWRTCKSQKVGVLLPIFFVRIISSFSSAVIFP